MREFRVSLTNRPGELARLTDVLSTQSINLRSVAVITEHNKAIACLVLDDVTAARQAFQDSRLAFEEAEVLSEMMENQPGQLGALATRMGNAGVNILPLYVLARDEPLVEVGFTVDDPKKAKKALGR
jgi:hypothetical protein